MRSAIASSALATAAIASLTAAAIAPLTRPPDIRGVPASHEVRLTAASIPPGAIPAAFLRNQITYCGLICPSVVQLVTTVPIGVLQSPFAFVAALQSGSILKAVGSAAESVTAPADAATTGIITPDVFIVVPKAFKALDVTVVQVFDVAAAVLDPATLGPAVETAREQILNALDQPATRPPSDLPTGAEGLVQVVAVEGINVASAVAFQAGELLLAGAVHVANVTATELARTGAVGEALGAGFSTADAVVTQARGIVTAAVNTAVTNVGNALHDPPPSTADNTTISPPTRKFVTAATARSKTSTTAASKGTVAAVDKSVVAKLTKTRPDADGVPTNASHRQTTHSARKAASGSREHVDGSVG
ncbi:hypothetical protein BH09ACT7_BH09ACT7_40540 [soil metagenome]